MGCATVKSGAHHDELASFDNYQSFAWIADQADFVVAYTVGTREKIVSTSYPTTYQGDWGWHLYGRYYYQTEVEHRTYTEGTLGIDIFDGKSKEPVWHGWASK